MRTFDFTPLYRSTVGFDRLADLIGTVAGNDVSNTSYPPFNIVKKSNDDYRISIAVAGLSEKDIKVEVHQNQLLVTAKKSDEGQRRRVSPSRNCREGLRSQILLGGPYSGHPSGLRRRDAPHRPQAGSSGSFEASHDQDQPR